MSARRFLPLAVQVLVFLSWGSVASAASLRAVVTIPGEAGDLSDEPPGLFGSRLGGFGSDLYYDLSTQSFYGVADSGPAKGALSRLPRIQQFSLNVDRSTGEISGFVLQKTIMLKSADGQSSFDGLNPKKLHADAATLGFSLDPEGLVIAPNGNFFIADEYGPALYEFAPVQVNGSTEARFVRSFRIPPNLIPIDSTGSVNYVAERESDPPLVQGRQDNRGFEGLAISPSGDTLFAMLQAPLADEGDRFQGRRSPNVRLVAFDTQTGASTAQYIYPLEEVNAINGRTDYPFADKDQGRNIGVSAIQAINDHQFLVLERDNRGMGPENPIGADPEASDVAVKRLYQIDISQASDASGISLAGISELPPLVTPVRKSLLLDVQSALESQSLAVAEKTEGLAIGPGLDDGQLLLVISTDNDSSALLTDAGLVDVFSDGSSGSADRDGKGRSLLPTYLYGIAMDLPEYVPRDFRPRLLPGDADQDLDFDQFDLVRVQQAAKYLTGLPATWGEGDWDGAPGGELGQPPAGDGLFNHLDIIASLSVNAYLSGPYASTGSHVSGLAPRAIPEPRAVILLVLGLAPLVGRWLREEKRRSRAA